MYRLLEVGEVIENGDEYWSNEGWRRYQHEIGNRFVPGRDDHPSRRLVKPAVTPAASSVPDPGEGYRLIDKAIDKPEPGDEYWNDVRKVWETRCFGVRDTSRFTSRDIYRRKLPAVPAQPAPVVSVGDRVKVLSGPWAGCTGVVIGSLPMNLKIKMDNVFVGGNNLTMIVGKTSSVEPLPPVVPEVLYRDLAIGEVIRQGDQYWLFGRGPWEDVRPNMTGSPVKKYHANHRRPVRVQSPGWRYLDAGETVQAGDETEYSVPPIWRCASGCSSYLGRVFEGHDKFFRRKLPSNQGG